MNTFTWIEARTAQQAAEELASPRGGAAVLKAGGVDLLDRLKEGLDAPERLVSIRRAGGAASPGDMGLGDIVEVKAAALPPEVARLLPGGAGGEEQTAQNAQTEKRDCVRLGALTTLAQLAAHPLIASRLPALAESAHGAATPQIRAVATLGGNLMQRPRCWYFRSADWKCKKKGGDECFALDPDSGENDFHAIFDNKPCAAVHASATATALLALDAIVVTVGAKGPRQARLGGLLLSPAQPGGDVTRENRLDPTEVITAVYVPLPRPDEKNVYLKVKQKQSFDWPLAEVAIAAKLSATGTVASCKVVLGAVAPVPWRARAAETALQRLAKLDEAGLLAVGTAAVEGARPLSKNAYKVPLVRGLVQQAVQALLGKQA